MPYFYVQLLSYVFPPRPSRSGRPQGSARGQARQVPHDSAKNEGVHATNSTVGHDIHRVSESSQSLQSIYCC